VTARLAVRVCARAGSAAAKMDKIPRAAASAERRHETAKRTSDIV
jgi:hypothetical protein